MKKYLSEEDYNEYETVLKTQWGGLYTLDCHVYTRMFGYKDRWEYYNAVTVGEYLNEIKVPLFSLEADDDQICDPGCVPHDLARSKGSSVCIGNTKCGAHVCHMKGSIVPQTWYEEPIMEFFNFMEKRGK